MAARLKVFVTSDGLTDYVVATTSRAKALDAWGSHQDLFKVGLARETDDPALVEAAASRPGQVLKRAAGSRATLERLKPAKAHKPAKPAGPSPAALKEVADLEAKLAAAAVDHERERAALDARHASVRARLEASLAKARTALTSR